MTRNHLSVKNLKKIANISNMIITIMKSKKWLKVPKTIKIGENPETYLRIA